MIEQGSGLEGKYYLDKTYQDLNRKNARQRKAQTITYAMLDVTNRNCLIYPSGVSNTAFSSVMLGTYIIQDVPIGIIVKPQKGNPE